MDLRSLAREYIKMAREVLERAKSEPVDYWTLRQALEIASMGENRLVEVLRELARRHGGCVSCRRSRPAGLSLTMRECELGLSQDRCNRREPLL